MIKPNRIPSTSSCANLSKKDSVTTVWSPNSNAAVAGSPENTSTVRVLLPGVDSATPAGSDFSSRVTLYEPDFGRSTIHLPSAPLVTVLVNPLAFDTVSDTLGTGLPAFVRTPPTVEVSAACAGAAPTPTAMASRLRSPNRTVSTRRRTRPPPIFQPRLPRGILRAATESLRLMVSVAIPGCFR